MTPTPVTRRANRTKVSRKVMCRNYDNCLDTAIAQNWEGFSCEKCSEFKALQWDRQQWIKDRTKCMALMYAMLRLGYRDALH